MSDAHLDALANNVAQKIKEGLVASKGEFWARKVLYLTGVKSMVQTMEVNPNFSGMGAALNKMVSSDVTMDVIDHYPDREPKALLEELLADCEGLLATLFTEATLLDTLTKHNPDSPNA